MFLQVKKLLLLELVMNIEDKTLCIDQPEDDLDLTFISNTVIPLIKTTRKISKLLS